MTAILSNTTKLIEFYELDTGIKLLIPNKQRKLDDQEAQGADQTEVELKALKVQLKAQGIELDDAFK